MDGDQRPGKAAGSRLRHQVAQPFDKIIPVLIIKKDLSPLDAPGDDMMRRARCVYSGASRHAGVISEPLSLSRSNAFIVLFQLNKAIFYSGTPFSITKYF